jgi:hypothetical protein
LAAQGHQLSIEINFEIKISEIKIEIGYNPLP